MIIGIDIRPLQTGHKYRGIGEVTKQVTNRILCLAKKNGHEIIFYEYTDGDDPKKTLKIPSEMKYDVVKLGKQPENDKNASMTQKIVRNISGLYGGPIKNSHRSDVFLQFDYAFGVPKDTKTLLIKHDLIPYVFWDRFFESPLVPLKNRALRTTARTIYANFKFKRVLKRSLANAKKIIAVSNSTKNDIKKFFNIKEDKIEVAHLGVDAEPSVTQHSKDATEMPSKPYLLFVGAGDERRRVDDLVAAYNNLKAQGKDIQLVLVGENFKNPKKIPNKRTRDAILSSSYQNDILTLGYVNDVTKQKLFKEALAFVYPTQYEGFGIPILEAFLLETPVITYKNSSIPEVGGDQAIYAKDWTDIVDNTKVLLSENEAKRATRISSAKKYAKQFTWDKTTEKIFETIEELNK